MRQYKSDRLLPIRSLIHANNRRLTVQQAESQKGFTIIELMVVLIIIAILAAIAIPSYRRYVIRNAEDEAKAQMQQLQIQLEGWRASALSYKDFYPQNGVGTDGKPSFAYNDNPTNKTIYIPLGSGSTDHRYQITLVDSSDKSLTNDAAIGRSWKMFAVPNPNGVASSGYRFKMDSTGKQCQSKDNSITISDEGCGINSEAW